MRLAFNGQAHYSDFGPGYDLYRRRARRDDILDKATYNRVVRQFCKMLSDRLTKEGIVDLPCQMGTIAASSFTRKPQYRGKQFVGYGKMDWKNKRYDGNLKAFGLVYMPRRGNKRNENLRCYGFVANRALYKTMQRIHEGAECPWRPVEFKDDMI
jgi:hypothetical protein